MRGDRAHRTRVRTGPVVGVRRERSRVRRDGAVRVGGSAPASRVAQPTARRRRATASRMPSVLGVAASASASALRRLRASAGARVGVVAGVGEPASSSAASRRRRRPRSSDGSASSARRRDRGGRAAATGDGAAVGRSSTSSDSSITPGRPEVQRTAAGARGCGHAGVDGAADAVDLGLRVDERGGGPDADDGPPDALEAVGGEPVAHAHAGLGGVLGVVGEDGDEHLVGQVGVADDQRDALAAGDAVVGLDEQAVLPQALGDVEQQPVGLGRLDDAGVGDGAGRDGQRDRRVGRDEPRRHQVGVGRAGGPAAGERRAGRRAAADRRRAAGRGRGRRHRSTTRR